MTLEYTLWPSLKRAFRFFVVGGDGAAAAAVFFFVFFFRSLQFSRPLSIKQEDQACWDRHGPACFAGQCSETHCADSIMRKVIVLKRLEFRTCLADSAIVLNYYWV